MAAVLIRALRSTEIQIIRALYKSDKPLTAREIQKRKGVTQLESNIHRTLRRFERMRLTVSKADDDRTKHYSLSKLGRFAATSTWGNADV